MNRYSHRPGDGRGPGYEQERDSQFVRNSAAILHYIDGGEIEMKINGNWYAVRALPRMNVFHVWPARPAGWVPNPFAITVEEAWERN